MSGFIAELKNTLSELGSAFTTARPQVIGMAKKDLIKKTKKSGLGWFWLFFQPVIYILCFYLALYIGVKNTKNGLDGGAYILWLASGVVPWWYMRSALGSGPTCFRRYSFLVTRLKFPVALIPVFTELSTLMFQCMLVALLIGGYFLLGNPLTIYFVQLPFIMILMFIFWTGFSLMTAPLVAISDDVGQLIKALQTPIFWLSGVIFDVASLNNPLFQFLLKFDPACFFVTCYRNILSGTQACWVWEDPGFFWLGMLTIVVTIIVGLLVYSRCRKDLADVL